jgi:hypothetical protein
LDLVSASRFVISEYYQGKLLFSGEFVKEFPLPKLKYKHIDLQDMVSNFSDFECLVLNASKPVPTDTEMTELPPKYQSTSDDMMDDTSDDDVSEDDASQGSDTIMENIDQDFEFDEYYKEE